MKYNIYNGDHYFMSEKKDDANSKILKFTAIFAIIYMLSPVIFFDLVTEHIGLFYVFLVPSAIWSLFNMNAFDDIAYLIYTVIIAIFWVICFLGVKLVVKVYNEIRRKC